jgi:hypothetical protein
MKGPGWVVSLPWNTRVLCVVALGLGASCTTSPAGPSGDSGSAADDGSIDVTPEGASDSGPGPDATRAEGGTADATTAADAATDARTAGDADGQTEATTTADANPGSDATTAADGVAPSDGACAVDLVPSGWIPPDAGLVDALAPCGALGQACCNQGGPYFCNDPTLTCEPAGVSWPPVQPTLCVCTWGNCNAEPIPGGGDPTQFLVVGPKGPETVSQGIAWDGTSQYYLSGTGVYSVPATGLPEGGTAKQLATMPLYDQTTPLGAHWAGLSIAIDSTSVYADTVWNGTGPPAELPGPGGTGWCLTEFPLLGLPEGGVAPCTYSSSDYGIGSRILVDDSRVYWSSASSVFAAPKDGGPAVALAQADVSAYESMPFSKLPPSFWAVPPPNLAPLLADESYLYTVDGASIVQISKSTGASRVLAVVPSQVGVGAPIVVGGIAVDATNVYWTENGPVTSIGPQLAYVVGFVRTASLSGDCTVATLARARLEFNPIYVGGPIPPLSYPSAIGDIVVYGAYVYWVGFDGIWRLAK